MNGRGDTIDVTPVWDAIRRYLENRKSQIYAALINYPAPIAGCDVQYQQLSERRDRIIRELDRLEAFRRERPEGQDPGEAVDAFVGSSDFIDGEAARNFVAGALGER